MAWFGGRRRIKGRQVGNDDVASRLNGKDCGECQAGQNIVDSWGFRARDGGHKENFAKNEVNRLGVDWSHWNIPKERALENRRVRTTWEFGWLAFKGFF